jgi:Fe-Mn family superoxide dismutase
MPFTLPPLPYPYDALEPHIDARTMEIHHTKHHQAYVNNLNAAVEKAPELAGKSIDELMRGINGVPEPVRAQVRNNGGGHWNHSMFWELMSANAGGEPSGRLADAITSAFGDFAKFKEQFAAAGTGRFGSGWGWVL